MVFKINLLVVLMFGLGLLALVVAAYPALSLAQTLTADLQGIFPAMVIEVVSENRRLIPGTDNSITTQTVRARIIAGKQSGEEIILENDYQPLSSGDRFFMHYTVYDGATFYTVGDLDRRRDLGLLGMLFVVVVIAFGRWQGVRSLLALGGSLAAIIFILLPWLLAGGAPLLASAVTATLILTVAIYLTHGWNWQSSAALLGTVATVILTAGLATWAVNLLRLSGLATEEAVYLNLGTAGALDFRGLLLGAFIIGMLGVLDDIAVTQVSVVAELKQALPAARPIEIYRRALRVGREHVGALVNTLVLAYTGSALPLLLLFSLSDAGVLTIINREVFTTEIARTIIGSVGLILAVPFSTGLAVWLVRPGGSGVHHH